MFLDKKAEVAAAGRRRRGWDTEESDSTKSKDEEKSTEEKSESKKSDAKEDEKSSKTSTGIFNQSHFLGKRCVVPNEFSPA